MAQGFSGFHDYESPRFERAIFIRQSRRVIPARCSGDSMWATHSQRRALVRELENGVLSLNLPKKDEKKVIMIKV